MVKKRTKKRYRKRTIKPHLRGTIRAALLRGGPGGPGRGKSEGRVRLAAAVDLIDLVEEAAIDGIIKSKDLKDKLAAAKLAFNVAGLKKSREEVSYANPSVIQAYLDLHGQALAHGGWEMIALWIIQHCADCPKFPGRDSFPFDDAPGPDGD